MKTGAISLVFAALSLALPAGFAGSPLFIKPANIDVDSRGRVRVAEDVNYRSFRGNDGGPPEKIPFRLLQRWQRRAAVSPRLSLTQVKYDRPRVSSFYLSLLSSKLQLHPSCL